MWTQNSVRTGKHINQCYNTLMKGRLPEGKLSEKMNKYHCPEDCLSLIEVSVSQDVWDNMSPSAHERFTRR